MFGCSKREFEMGVATWNNGPFRVQAALVLFDTEFSVGVKVS
jgi:hypothetical protein